MRYINLRFTYLLTYFVYKFHVLCTACLFSLYLWVGHTATWSPFLGSVTSSFLLLFRGAKTGNCVQLTPRRPCRGSRQTTDWRMSGWATETIDQSHCLSLSVARSIVRGQRQLDHSHDDHCSAGKSTSRPPAPAVTSSTQYNRVTLQIVDAVARYLILLSVRGTRRNGEVLLVLCVPKTSHFSFSIF